MKYFLLLLLAGGCTVPPAPKHTSKTSAPAPAHGIIIQWHMSHSDGGQTIDDLYGSPDLVNWTLLYSVTTFDGVTNIPLSRIFASNPPVQFFRVQAHFP